MQLQKVLQLQCDPNPNHGRVFNGSRSSLYNYGCQTQKLCLTTHTDITVINVRVVWCIPLHTSSVATSKENSEVISVHTTHMGNRFVVMDANLHLGKFSNRSIFMESLSYAPFVEPWCLTHDNQWLLHQCSSVTIQYSHVLTTMCGHILKWVESITDK